MQYLQTTQYAIGKLIVFLGHAVLIALAIAVPPLFMSMLFDILPLVAGCFAVLLIGAAFIFAGDWLADSSAGAANVHPASTGRGDAAHASAIAVHNAMHLRSGAERCQQAAPRHLRRGALAVPQSAKSRRMANWAEVAA
jgi:hypothetical protein